MLRLHGKAAPDLLTALARDGSLPGEVRVRALRDLNGHGDLACVRELLPLLDDATIVENQTSLCQHAAAAIAALLGHAGGGHFYGAEPALQADTLQKVRQAIFDAGIK
jgi:HEAT repeat protein